MTSICWKLNKEIKIKERVQIVTFSVILHFLQPLFFKPIENIRFRSVRNYYFQFPGIVLIAVAVFSGFFNFYQEKTNSAIMESFKKMVPKFATVIRDGENYIIPSEEIVTGIFFKRFWKLLETMSKIYKTGLRFYCEIVFWRIMEKSSTHLSSVSRISWGIFVLKYQWRKSPFLEIWENYQECSFLTTNAKSLGNRFKNIELRITDYYD